MRGHRLLLLLIFLVSISSALTAERLAIGQVDTGRLLTGQRVDLFVSIDTGGGEATMQDLHAYESADGINFTEVEITDLSRVRSLDAALSFYMLVDNSGSMYDETIAGDSELTRIEAATQAIRDFANSITNNRDQIGLAVFNTSYSRLLSPSRDKNQIGPALGSIQRPGRADGYTELYAGLVAAASDASAQGRRTVVVLSDGENYPYSVYEGEGHPEYGERLFTYEDAIDAFQREGLSVFAIHYGAGEDPNLDLIAEATGGSVYRASGPQDLALVYQEIRDTLLDEYRLSYRASMIPAERRYVRVTYDQLTADRLYFANTLFAGATGVGTVFLIIVFAVGLIGLAALLFVSIRAGAARTSLVLIDSGGAKGIDKTIALGSADTIIGASPEADVTIAGNPTISEKHAVVTFEPARSEYTIVSDSPVRVNNQPTTKRVLKPGDVVNIEGTIFAYDESEQSAEDKPEA